jgi:hypothetical protein
MMRPRLRPRRRQLHETPRILRDVAPLRGRVFVTVKDVETQRVIDRLDPLGRRVDRVVDP